MTAKQVRMNVSTLVNASKIRREKRNGRDVIVVPSATLPDGIVMNGSGGRIRYPAKAIADSFHTLEGTPAPLGHPAVNGRFVSASSPDGIVRGFVGAHNENVRQENGRVMVDKVIDVAFANQSEGGKRVLEAIDKQKPIHTSTGLLATLNTLSGDPDADYEVDSMVLDHDALLLDEPGAATPEQGVGVFVNSAGDKVEVINCTIGDQIDNDLAWSAESMLRTVERKERLPLLQRIIQIITAAVQGSPMPDDITGDALDEEDEPMDKAQFDELNGKVSALTDTLAGLGDTIATAVGNAMKPVTDAMAAQATADKAKADAEHAELVGKVVNAGLLTKELAETSTAPVLNALLEKAGGPPRAFNLNGAFTANQGGKPTYKLPEGD